MAWPACASALAAFFAIEPDTVDPANNDVRINKAPVVVENFAIAPSCEPVRCRCAPR
jgi:hypothetical protein